MAATIKRKPKKPAPEGVFNKVKFTMNDLATIMNRASAIAGRDPSNSDPRRDYNAECGYPSNPTVRYFTEMYDTDGIANRIVSIFPNECFGVSPEVYETDGPKKTPMEKDWLALCDDPYTNPIEVLHQADIESRKGRFGAILYGYDDGKDLSLPVEGVDRNDLPVPRSRDNKLLYLRAFNEGSVWISKIETDKTCRRFGKPLTYMVKFVDNYRSVNGITEETGSVDQEVHWTRMQHIAENGKLFHAPILLDSYKRVLDLGKILGSSAEMFYKGGFAPLSLELDPRVLELRDVTFDLASLQEDVQKFVNGLQRVLTLVGFTAKSLAPQVASPTDQIQAQLTIIAITYGIPLRIFMGSEAGQLASAQDVKNWNRRLKLRQKGYIQNYMLRPMVNRLIAVGAIRPPKAGPEKYKVFWPDVNIPDDNEQSQIADRLAAALMKYRMSGAYSVMKLATFLREVLHFTPDQVAVMIEELKSDDGLSAIYDKMDKMLAPPPKGPADSGSSGNPPSNPPKGGVTD